MTFNFKSTFKTMSKVMFLHVPLTHIVQHLVPLQLCVSDLVLQHRQLLFVLLFESVQTPLAVLQLVYQLLLDGDLTGDVCQVGLHIFCTRAHKHTSLDLAASSILLPTLSHSKFNV